MITQAYRIEYDERTDTREPLRGRLGPIARKKLGRRIEAGRAKVLPGVLVGWPGVTHTVRDGSCYYHVALAE